MPVEKVEVLVGGTVQRHVTYDIDTQLLVVTSLESEGGKPVTTDSQVTITWRLTDQLYSQGAELFNQLDQLIIWGGVPQGCVIGSLVINNKQMISY